jgi:hypothetical protein
MWVYVTMQVVLIQVSEETHAATEQLTIQRVLCMACVLCRQDLCDSAVPKSSRTCFLPSTVLSNETHLFSVRRIMQSLTQASIEVITAARRGEWGALVEWRDDSAV